MKIDAINNLADDFHIVSLGGNGRAMEIFYFSTILSYFQN